ncbi:hypothetical protein [Halomonas sp. MS1]|nr:hypothetical protein [Halomonas sp. MS1]UTD55037.1 hypothetical protein NF683_18105 [Halomonas sp. MS1]
MTKQYGWLIIVLVATCCFFLALLFSPRHGVLMRLWRHRKIATADNA